MTETLGAERFARTPEAVKCEMPAEAIDSAMGPMHSNAMTPYTDRTALLGRLLIAVIFLVSGVQKLAGFGGTVDFMGAEGLPLPVAAAVISIGIECIGGFLLIVGYQTRLVAIVLAVWCIATALVAHRDFSNQDQMIHFLKNVAMAGGLLQVVAFGAGAWSVDARSRF